MVRSRDAGTGVVPMLPLAMRAGPSIERRLRTIAAEPPTARRRTLAARLPDLWLPLAPGSAATAGQARTLKARLSDLCLPLELGSAATAGEARTLEARLSDLCLPLELGSAEPPPARRRTLAARLPDLCLPLEPGSAATVVRAVVVGVPLLGLLLGGVVLALAGTLAVATAAVLAVRTAPTRRDAHYERELPELLEQLARHLRAGGSLAQAVASASPPVTPSGLAAEWAQVVAHVLSLGVGPALDRWGASTEGGRRTSTRLAAAALAMAADTGGSPAQAVDGVAATLRSRLAVADEVRALASQARASSIVIALAPLGFAAFAGATDDRTAAFFRSPAGVVVAAAGLTLDALGAWWMAHLCRPPAADRGNPS